MSEAPEGSDEDQPNTIDRAQIIKIGGLDPLTRIRNAYTLASPHEPNANEADDLMIKHFLNTLAEISLAVASRRASQ
jgi:hypothetical protein